MARFTNAATVHGMTPALTFLVLNRSSFAIITEKPAKKILRRFSYFDKDMATFCLGYHHKTVLFWTNREPKVEELSGKCISHG